MRLEGIYSLVESKGILKEINFDFNEGELYYVVVENEKTGVNIFDIIGLVSPIMKGKYIINGCLLYTSQILKLTIKKIN